jgi:FdhD protein
LSDRTRTYQGQRWQNGVTEGVEDALTIEHPLSIAINGAVFSLTMQTPGDEDDLVTGLLFTEGVYKGPYPLDILAHSRNALGHTDKVELTISEELLSRAALTKRNLLSSSSCGICGTTELPNVEGKLALAPQIAEDTIQLAMRKMADEQNAFRTSGGCHGAAAFNPVGQMLCLREDIGRHNAVDKVIGYLVANDLQKSARLLTVSGRVSYEIVYKCFAAGIPTLAAVSAPSSLAVDYCKELGIQLYGFCRDDRMTRYA